MTYSENVDETTLPFFPTIFFFCPHLLLSLSPNFLHSFTSHTLLPASHTAFLPSRPTSISHFTPSSPLTSHHLPCRTIFILVSLFIVLLCSSSPFLSANSINLCTSLPKTSHQLCPILRLPHPHLCRSVFIISLYCFSPSASLSPIFTFFLSSHLPTSHGRFLPFQLPHSCARQSIFLIHHCSPFRSTDVSTHQYTAFCVPYFSSLYQVLNSLASSSCSHPNHSRRQEPLHQSSSHTCFHSLS